MNDYIYNQPTAPSDSNFHYLTQQPPPEPPTVETSPYDGLDVIALFEQAVLKALNDDLFKELTSLAFNSIGAILGFYFLFGVIKAALTNDRSEIVKVGGTFLWVCVVTAFTQADIYNSWVIELTSTFRKEFVSFFTGENNGVWDFIANGLQVGQKLIMKESGGVSNQVLSVLYGAGMWLTYFALYLSYSLVYLGALIPLLILQFLGGVILLFASIPAWRGIAKSWALAMVKYTMICVISSLLVIVCVSVGNMSAEDAIVGKDGVISMKFLIAMLSSWITIRFLPKAAEIVTDVFGGSTPSSAGDAQAGADMAKAISSNPAMSAAKGAMASKSGSVAKAVGSKAWSKLTG
ncbi:hypothetical protein [Vibrio sp. 10N.261.46.A3]|uniref:hypothetical protein n=1 Tax=Vibrio sp. 10N.261.46.A3 TaxID=3229658 RepID=UPI003553AB12